MALATCHPIKGGDEFRLGLHAEVTDHVPDSNMRIVNDSDLENDRQIRLATKAAVEQLINRAHARTLLVKSLIEDPIRNMDGIALPRELEEESVSLFILDLPYATGANPRSLKMANNFPEAARDLPERVTPLLRACLKRV